jgi:RNase P/RNase MRP subunit POP5
MKLKTKSSAKIHRRYLLLEAKSKNEIEQTILDYLGILGWARAAPLFVTTKNTPKFILAVERKELINIRAAFEISPNKIRVLKVSGTLSGLE